MGRQLSKVVAVAVALLSAAAGHAQADTYTSLGRVQAEGLARATVAQSSATGPVSVRGTVGPDCLAPAGDPAPGTQAFKDRDQANMVCATQRLTDEVASPAFGAVFWSQTPGIYANQNLKMLLDPLHPHLTLSQLVAGGSTTDPFRTLARWTAAGRGRVTDVSFPAADGATLNGHIFRPPASVPGPYPGVVITTGSIQGYQQMYYWAAEGLAEAGYMVLTYDVQGQGDSDTLPANCTVDSCPGVPFQQGYNFYQGAQDALNYFLSSAAAPYRSSAVSWTASNPFRAELDATKIGIAGHSLGAGAVSFQGQCDPRVKAIVAWDNLAPAAGDCRAQIPEGLPAGAPATPSLTTPALGINSEYFFNPSPTSTAPDQQAKSGAFKQLSAAGTDTMQIGLRASTHLEYTYVPYILPASRLGERVAWYYTLAWMDRYVRGRADAFTRLTAERFDASADASAIGAGRYDASAALARPTDPAAGNAPYRIAGLPVADRLSFYGASQYALTPPSGGAKVTCSDLRHACR